MINNESRLQIECLLRPIRSTQEIIESELIKVNYSIDRKWAILDDYSLNWSFTQWRNFKDSLYGEISYKEYLLILQKQLKK
jgi:hypothetical protein